MKDAIEQQTLALTARIVRLTSLSSLRCTIMVSAQAAYRGMTRDQRAEAKARALGRCLMTFIMISK